MKKLGPALFYIAFLPMISNAQQQTPQLLKQPANWQFERFALPPEFAPNIPYKGVEELRFAQGTFKKDSALYFTYAFVAELDNVQSISQEDIKNYLLKYYKGLCFSEAQEKKLSVDTSKITVELERNKDVTNEVLYNAVANIFGVFADGAPVKLNMEIEVLANAATSKIYLVFIASPREKTDPAWKKLYEIRNQFAMP